MAAAAAVVCNYSKCIRNVSFIIQKGYVPACIRYLGKNLKTLELKNYKDHLRDLTYLTRLVELVLSNNGLREFPKEIFSLPLLVFYMFVFWG